ncbi:hypothetical protein H0H92_004795 [Tricholoma furcatifolium]|nr:hypothetical protein H0H92_004795 [Tricholoma furcatifolium]
MTTSEVSQVTSRPPVAKPTKRTKLRSEESSGAPKQTKAEKKANRRKTDVEPQEVSEAPAEPTSKKKKKEKKRKRDAEVVDGSAEDAEENNERKKNAEVVDGSAEDAEENNERKKKRTKKSEPESTTMDVVVPPKKRKNKTGFPDPHDDASLSEQSQKWLTLCIDKGLAYAFLQFHRPSKWKFNKARQNWLIRNIWSNEMVPEVHLPLVYAYLLKVQGGVRENLIQSCRSALEKKLQPEIPSSDDTEKPKDASAEPAPAPTDAATENTQTIRAQTLLDLLDSPV